MTSSRKKGRIRSVIKRREGVKDVMVTGGNGNGPPSGGNAHNS